jgi:hypothetical protein
MEKNSFFCPLSADNSDIAPVKERFQPGGSWRNDNPEHQIAQKKYFISQRGFFSVIREPVPNG